MSLAAGSTCSRATRRGDGSRPCSLLALGPMKVAHGRVVHGAIKTRARFPEGARLTLVQHDERPPIALDAEEEAGVLMGIAEIEAGRGLPGSRLRAKLRRRR